MKRAAYAFLLLLLLLALAIGRLVGTPAGSRWLVAHALRAGGAEAQHIDGTLWRALKIQGLRWREGERHFSADRLTLRWRPVALVGGRLHLTRLEGADIRLTLPPSPASTEPPGFDLPLPLAVTVDHLVVADLEIAIGPRRYAVQKIDGAMTTDGRSLRIDLDALEAWGGTLRGNARLALERPNALKADLHWTGALADLGPVRLTATLGGNLTVPRIDARLTQPFAFGAKGHIDLTGATPRLDLSGEWQQARWPLTGPPGVASRTGRYHLTGPLDDYRLQAEARLTTWRLKAMRLRLDGRGDTRGLRPLTLEAELLGGNATARGALSWSPSVTWRLDLTGHHLDPAALDTRWPGRLDLKSAVKGRIADNGLHLDIPIDRLKGRLRGYPVDGSGAFAMNGDRYRFQTIRLESGKNRLYLNGHIGDTLDLDFRLDAPRPDALLPDLDGHIEGKGHIGGRLARPELKLEATLADLRYRDTSVDTGDLQLDWRKDGGRGELRLSGANLAGLRQQTLTLRLAGRPDRHTLVLAGQGPRLNLHARASGGWRSGRWQGELKRLDLRPPHSRAWRLQRPVSLTLGPGQYHTGRLCLARHQARLCATAGLARKRLAGALEVNRLPLSLLRPWLPADYRIQGEADGHATLGGTLDAPRLQGALALPKGRITLRPRGKRAHHILLANGRMDLDYRQDRLELEAHTAIESSGALRATLEAGPGQNGIRPLQGRIQLVFTDLTPFRTLLPQAEGLKGRMHGDFRIAGDSRHPRLSGELQLQEGTMRIPPLGITLDAIQVAVRSTGADRIRLDGSARSGDGALKIGGELQLNAARGWPATLEIKGHDITFLQRSEVFATATPDLRLERAHGRTILRGRLLIPKAEITLDTVPKGAINVSRDEVIVDTHPPGGPPAREETALPLQGRVRVTLGNEVRFKGLGLSTRLNGDIELRITPHGTTAFGQLNLVDGRYKAYGQNLAIDRGHLLFAGPLDNPELNVRAVRPSNDGAVTAVIQVTGTARAPQTRIFTEPPTSSDEALSYLLTGDPLDRLGQGDKLDLKRKAIGYGLEKLAPAFSALGSRVGLDELKLSSDAVTLGKRLSPKLYVGYLVDLFDNEGVWLLRYQINRFLQLETRSGEQKSVDLLYSYERD